MAKPSIPRTRAEKGKWWATGTLLICGTFSIYANVRSGAIAMEPIIVSVMPPLVAFMSSHLISYFSPKGKWGKIGLYGGFGAICVIAMYASGDHIIDTVMRNGQSFAIGVMYVIITDAPMLLAAGILSQKVSTVRSAAKPVEPVTPPQTVPNPAKRTPAKKATTPPIKTVPAKSTKPRASRAKAKETDNQDILSDPLEREMLNA